MTKLIAWIKKLFTRETCYFEGRWLVRCPDETGYRWIMEPGLGAFKRSECCRCGTALVHALKLRWNEDEIPFEAVDTAEEPREVLVLRPGAMSFARESA